MLSASLDHAWIEAHVPHKGTMCLLERVVEWSDQRIVCEAISHTDPANPLRDRRVRQAISSAIDRTALVERVMLGEGAAAGHILPAGYPGVDPDRRPDAFDLGRARRLLAEAGYPDGFTMGLVATNDRYVNDEQVAQAVAQMLARVGIQVRLEALPGAIVVQRATDAKAAFNDKPLIVTEWNVQGLKWVPDQWAQELQVAPLHVRQRGSVQPDHAVGIAGTARAAFGTAVGRHHQPFRLHVRHRGRVVPLGGPGDQRLRLARHDARKAMEGRDPERARLERPADHAGNQQATVAQQRPRR